MWTGEDGYVNNDRFRVDGDKNMRLLAFAFAIVFVWTGPLSDGANFSFIRWGFNLEIFRVFFSGSRRVFSFLEIPIYLTLRVRGKQITNI